MKKPQMITVELLSDATFSRGEGTAGVVDIEIEHDEFGLPFMGGKTLHGLLRDGWLSMEGSFPELRSAADRIYGPPGDLAETSILRIGDAELERAVKEWVAWSVRRKHNPLSPGQILAALSDIRAQTSEERESGAPAETTLRSTRVVLRGLLFISPLTWLAEPTTDDLRCLALGVLAARHAGLARHRGRGLVRLALDGDHEMTHRYARGEELEL